MSVPHRAHAHDALLHAATDIGMLLRLLDNLHGDPAADERQIAQAVDDVQRARRQLERAEGHLRLLLRVPTLF